MKRECRSPNGKHDPEYCIYSGCYDKDTMKRALELHEVVQAQINDPSGTKKLDAERVVSEMVLL